MAHRARRVSEETSLAIPVRAKDRILATVTVRYAATAVPLRTAVEQFLPKMREVAQKIEAEFEREPAAAHNAKRPCPRQSHELSLAQDLATPPEMSEVTSSNAPAIARPSRRRQIARPPHRRNFSLYFRSPSKW